LFGSIDDYNTILAIVQLHEKEKRGKPIWLVISSNGGSVIAAARLIAVMNSLKVPIYTVCELACESAAAAILVNGDKVYAREHSRIMFHNFVTQLTGSSSAIQEELEHTNKIFGDLNAPVLRRTSLTKEEFDAKLLKTWYLTSTEALNLKLLDGHVIISTELFKRDSTTSIPNVLEK
jgi:ATP-dependent protease ClpP protease subunit